MGFQHGLSGLNAASKNLDVIGNNVANAGTVGYKAGQAQFADVFASSLVGAGTSPAGMGAEMADIAQQFTQGDITSTKNPLDMAINGGGFFLMLDPAGAPYYTRNGQFQIDKSGFIVNSQGYRLTGYPADADGNIVPAGTTIPGAQSAIQISPADLPPQATGTSNGATGVQANLNLDSRKSVITPPFDANNPLSYSQSTNLNVYDSQGNAHAYTLYFRKIDYDTVTAGIQPGWEVHTSVTNPAGILTDVTPATVPVMVFGSDGQIDTANSINISATNRFTQTIADTDLATGAASLSFSVDFTGSTQFGSTFNVKDLAQDGFTSGRLTGFNISPDGIVLGRYSNGKSRNLAQVALANFRNPQGLLPQGNNLWAETSASGPALIGTPQSGSLGAIKSSAVEDSNVDLTSELVDMITAQRVYQANAQTIKTQDSLLQTLVNLR